MSAYDRLVERTTRFEGRGTHKTNSIKYYILILRFAQLKDGVGPIEHTQRTRTPASSAASAGSASKAGSGKSQ